MNFPVWSVRFDGATERTVFETFAEIDLSDVPSDKKVYIEMHKESLDVTDKRLSFTSSSKAQEHIGGGGGENQ